MFVRVQITSNSKRYLFMLSYILGRLVNNSLYNTLVSTCIVVFMVKAVIPKTIEVLF